MVDPFPRVIQYDTIGVPPVETFALMLSWSSDVQYVSRGAELHLAEQPELHTRPW